MRRLLCLLLTLAAPPAMAQTDVVDRAVAEHILPRFATLDSAAQALDAAAGDDCTPDSPALRDAYGTAFDAWVGVSHLRFGPTEEEERAFALAFWPDTRGMTPSALNRLIADADAAVGDPDEFATVSIAARGFYALEFLLYDDAIAGAGDAAYRCALIRAETGDIARIASDLHDAWSEDYAATLTGAPNDRYRSRTEAVQELYKALINGLDFTGDTRLGRPLGTFDRPRPERAEARRSGRSLRHVALSLDATRELALMLAGDAPVRDTLAGAFDRAEAEAADLDDPVLAGVADPQGRLEVEILKQTIDRARELIAADLAPHLGVGEGFNAMDGD